MNNKKFKFLEHTADIKFRAFGSTLEELFKNSVLAMFNSMHDGKIKSVIKKKIKVKGKDKESLLYNFLEELLFLFDSEGFFPARFSKIKINEKKLILESEIFGDNAKNYEIYLDVKAVTYNQMFIKQEKNKWVAQVVIDV